MLNLSCPALFSQCDGESLRREHALRSAPPPAALPYTFSVEFTRDLNVNLTLAFLESVAATAKAFEGNMRDRANNAKLSGSGSGSALAPFSPYYLSNQARFR